MPVILWLQVYRKISKAIWEGSGKLFVCVTTVSPPDIKMISRPCKTSSFCILSLGMLEWIR